MGKISVGGKEFTITDGKNGKVMLSQMLVNDENLSPRIKNDKTLTAIREFILTQTIVNTDLKTGFRIVSNTTNFFGGSVYSLDKTEEGFYLCVFRDTDKSGDGEPHPSETIRGILVMSLDGISEEGIALLEAEGLIDNGDAKQDKAIETPFKKPSEEFNPDNRTMDDATVMSKINDIMESKMSGKVKKVSAPL